LGEARGVIAGNDPLVSIVVAARNEAGTIEKCVRALQAQTYPRDKLEIFVADGRSEDGTRDIIRRLGSDDARVRLVDNPFRTTPHAFNVGLRAANGSILGIMSAHAEAMPDYVSRAVGGLRATGAWAIGGRIVRANGTPVQTAIGRVTSSPFGVGDAKHNFAAESGSVETVFPGMWPRAVLERVGVFDSELERNQDDELSFRIRQAGGTIWYDPTIAVVYQPRGTLRGLFRQYREYGMWKVRVWQKHPRALRPRQLVPPVWVLALVGGTAVGSVATVGWLVAGVAGGSYLVVMLIASRRIAGGGASAFDVLQALLTLHLAYGIGVWQGLVRFAPRWLTRGQVDLVGLPPSQPR
jgi:cellulose synthase/poly-beta-1,6-N-acetylglucosamine synthase-like glycosyltransferase